MDLKFKVFVTAFTAFSLNAYAAETVSGFQSANPSEVPTTSKCNYSPAKGVFEYPDGSYIPLNKIGDDCSYNELAAHDMNQVKLAYAKLGQTGQAPSAEQRISSIGSKFTRDSSNPVLGEAYRDPSGLIWGSVVKAQGSTKHMSEYDAEAYCKAGGARLPTREEFKQLAKYLGDGSAQGYSPYLADGKTEALPGLSKNWFWSSSVYPDYSGYADGFNGYGGDVGLDGRSSDDAVRCVSGR